MAEDLKKPEGSVVSLKDLYFRYSSEKGNSDVLQDINLSIGEGEFICVLGPSGCGKSTLLKILAGFIKPSSGEALMEGEAIDGPDYHKGVVFQNPVLYPWLNVEDNIGFGLKMRKFPKSEIEALTKKHLELVGLTGYEKYKPYELSGGMKQRVSLARTLVNKPGLVLMDEPFGALDSLTRANLQEHLMRIQESVQNTVIIITHDIDEAVLLSDRVIMMTNGPEATIGEILEVNLPRPRDRVSLQSDKEYIRCREAILEFLYKKFAKDHE